jgi:uncharacterized membrane protein
MVGTEAQLATPSRAASIILRAGLLAGVLDITAAFLAYAHSGAQGIRLLQGIASGLIGPAAFQGGLGTASLGLLCHFVIATLWAAIYFAMSRRAAFLREHAVVSGALYGVIIYLVMNLVVIPLSAIGPRPFSLSSAIVAAAILVPCVGVPIALTVRRLSSPAAVASATSDT